MQQENPTYDDLNGEHYRLSAKIKELSAFLESPNARELPLVQICNLMHQKDAMEHFRDILSHRISNPDNLYLNAAPLPIQYLPMDAYALLRKAHMKPPMQTIACSVWSRRLAIKLERDALAKGGIVLTNHSTNSIGGKFPYRVVVKMPRPER